jgi:hypothetical protein
MPRALTLSTSILEGRRLPVAGEVSFFLSHSSMAERSYVWLGVGVGLRLGSGVGFGHGAGLGFGCGCGLGLPGRPW